MLVKRLKGKAIKATQQIHRIEPVFDESSCVLLLGSFPSPKSREMGFFYGHPQNRMWKVLAAVLREPDIPASVEERRAFLIRNKIAMWDVLASCTIEGASDASIRDARPNDLSRILEIAPIRQIFTTGSKACELYRRFLLPILGRECVRLPSTSAANAAMRLEDMIAAYEIVARCIQDAENTVG